MKIVDKFAEKLLFLEHVPVINWFLWLVDKLAGWLTLLQHIPGIGIYISEFFTGLFLIPVPFISLLVAIPILLFASPSLITLFVLGFPSLFFPSHETNLVVSGFFAGFWGWQLFTLTFFVLNLSALIWFKFLQIKTGLRLSFFFTIQWTWFAWAGIAFWGFLAFPVLIFFFIFIAIMVRRDQLTA